MCLNAILVVRFSVNDERVVGALVHENNVRALKVCSPRLLRLFDPHNAFCYSDRSLNSKLQRAHMPQTLQPWFRLQIKLQWVIFFSAFSRAIQFLGQPYQTIQIPILSYGVFAFAILSLLSLSYAYET